MTGGLLAHLRLRPLKTKEHLQTRPARHSEEITRRRDPDLDSTSNADEAIPEDIAQVFGSSPLSHSDGSLSPSRTNSLFDDDNNNIEDNNNEDVTTDMEEKFCEEECWLEGPSSPDAGARAVLGALLARSPLALCVADMELSDHPLVYANEVFFQQTGYRPKDVLGKNCRFLQGEETDPDTMDEIRECLREGRSFDGEVINYSKTGKRLYNRLMLHPVRGRSGAMTHYIGIQHFSPNPHPPKQPLKAAASKPSATRTSMLAPRAVNMSVVVPSEPEDGSVVDPTPVSPMSPMDSPPPPPPKMTRQRADRRAGGICKVRPDHSVWLELVMRSVGPQALPVMPQAYESLKRHGRRGTIS
eukprot:jgi/Chlat1/4841/Chrsp31S04874